MIEVTTTTTTYHKIQADRFVILTPVNESLIIVAKDKDGDNRVEYKFEGISEMSLLMTARDIVRDTGTSTMATQYLTEIMKICQEALSDSGYHAKRL